LKFPIQAIPKLASKAILMSQLTCPQPKPAQNAAVSVSFKTGVAGAAVIAGIAREGAGGSKCLIINNLHAFQVLDPDILTKDNPQVWQEDIERNKAGKGLGEGESYTPWIGVGEFHSLGQEKLVPGRLVRRLHTTHSQIERAFLECLENRKGILDIREQFPLPLADTLRIAMDLVIRHPRDYCTKQVRVMTTDFLITSMEGLEACAIKNSQELRKTRTLQKLEMEKEYWTRQGIPWKLYTEKEAGISNVRNTAWLAEAMLFHGENYPLEIKKEIQKKAEELWRTPKVPTELAKEIDIALGLKNESLHIIKELIRERAWDWNSYHGLLNRDKFQLEQHWTGELVLRSAVPLTGFECEHLQSDVQKIQLTWDHKRNEKLKRKRRHVNAEARAALPPKPKKEKKIRVKNPKPDPFKARSEITQPYPDELVWSVLCRYYDVTGRPPINTFCTELWGSRNQPGTTSTNFLDKIAKHFAKSLNITDEVLKTQHTLCSFETKWGSCPKTRPM